MNTVHRLAAAFGCYSKLSFMELSKDRNYSVIMQILHKFSHSNIVFKIKVTKIAQKMLFSKQFCFNMVNCIVYLISGRAVGF